MKILLSGLPGAGKTHLGTCLSRNHGYYHLDMEDWPADFAKEIWDQGNIAAFVQQLDAVANNVVLSWGYPPSCLSTVREMRSLGVTTFWIDAPLIFCRRHWRPKEGQSGADFIRQIAQIEASWSELNDFYGDHAISVASINFSHTPESQIIEEIIAKANRYGRQ